MELEGEITRIETGIGSTIRSLRQMRGMSREQLSEILGVSHQQLAKYENGVNRISAGKLYLAAQAMNVSLDYFFKDMDSEVEGLDYIANSSVGGYDQLDLARNYANIKSTRKKELLRSIIKVFSED